MNVMERLLSYSPSGQLEDWEVPMIQADIENLRKKGWTDSEIVSKMRWMEHVDPTISEEVALRNMRLVNERVALRLAGK